MQKWLVVNENNTKICRRNLCTVYGRSAYQTRILYFTPVATIFFLSFCLLFSSPNLSGRRLDVCHTSTHNDTDINFLSTKLLLVCVQIFSGTPCLIMSVSTLFIGFDVVSCVLICLATLGIVVGLVDFVFFYLFYACY